MKKLGYIVLFLFLPIVSAFGQSSAQKLEKAVALTKSSNAVLQETMVDLTDIAISDQLLNQLSASFAEKDEIACVRSEKGSTLIFVHTDGVNTDNLKELLLAFIDSDFVIRESHNLTPEDISYLIKTLQ